MNINTKTTAAHTYDAIVVGTGISGGWAAKELCEQGLKTLVLERGRDVKHYHCRSVRRRSFSGKVVGVTLAVTLGSRKGCPYVIGS